MSLQKDPLNIVILKPLDFYFPQENNTWGILLLTLCLSFVCVWTPLNPLWGRKLFDVCSNCASQWTQWLASYHWPSFFQEESNLDDHEVDSGSNCSGEFDRVIPGSFSIQESLVLGCMPTPRRWQSKSTEPLRLTWHVYVTLAGTIVHPAVHRVTSFYRDYKRRRDLLQWRVAILWAAGVMGWLLGFGVDAWWPFNS